MSKPTKAEITRLMQRAYTLKAEGHTKKAYALWAQAMATYEEIRKQEK